MDHEQSIASRAAESYLLGRLPPAEREEFEQHYFECAECAEEVRLGFQFSQNLKSVFHEEGRERKIRFGRIKGGGWFAPIWTKAPLAACLAVAAFSGYQNAVEIPALRARTASLAAPRVLIPIVLAPSSRAQAPSLTIAAGANFVPVSLAPGAARNAGEYECRLRSESGKTLWRLPVPALDPEANLTIEIPTMGLADGNYEAILAGITGQDTTELDHYAFSIRRN